VTPFFILILGSHCQCRTEKEARSGLVKEKKFSAMLASSGFSLPHARREGEKREKREEGEKRPYEAREVAISPQQAKVFHCLCRNSISSPEEGEKKKRGEGVQDNAFTKGRKRS